MYRCSECGLPVYVDNDLVLVRACDHDAAVTAEMVAEAHGAGGVTP